jgi:hypothetical protein
MGKTGTKVLPPTFVVTEVTNFFEPNPNSYRLEEGPCIYDLVEESRVDNAYAHVFVNGEEIEREIWASIPEPGDEVVIRLIPHGGDPQKIQSIIMIIGFVLFFLGGPLFLIAAAVINLGISLAFPPPKQKLYPIESKNSPVILGTRNVLRKWQVIPVIIGQHRVWPMLAAKPYTETIGEDQFLLMLFEICMGPVELDQNLFRIGDTNLSEFEDVEVEIREGYDTDLPRELFTENVTEESFNQELVEGQWYTRTTDVNVTAGNIDVTMPAGLISFATHNGSPLAVTLNCEIQYRVHDPVGSWVDPVLLGPPGPGVTSPSNGKFSIEGKHRGLTLRGVRWKFPSADKYDIQVRLESVDKSLIADENSLQDEIRWTRLRSSVPVDPITTPEVATIALRIKASDQLNGQIETFNCFVEALVPKWNEVEGWEVAGGPFKTQSAPWYFANVFRGNANKRPVADSRVDGARMAAWANFCEDPDNNFKINAVVDIEKTVDEVARNIAATSRAIMTMHEGMYSVVIDQPNATAIQVFSPRNSSEFQGQMNFDTPPHALIMRFISPDDGWDTAEFKVYDDGYSEDGLEPGTVEATEFQEVDLWGITDPDLVYKHARYHIAANRLRKSKYTLKADWEHIICNRGDRVDVMHDAPLIGISTGRIKEWAYPIIFGIGGIRSDERLPFDPTKTYEVIVRKADGLNVTLELLTYVDAGEYDLWFFNNYVANGDDPAPGDMFVFGEVSLVVKQMIVNGISPQQDLTAILELIEYNPAIYDADQGEIPPYEPGTTVPSRIENRVPPTPSILDVRSGEDVLFFSADGRVIPRILISLEPPDPFYNITSAIVHYQLSDPEGPWTPISVLDLSSMQVSVLPVEELESYNVRLRYVTQYGVGSEWATVSDHTVVGRTTPPPSPTDAIISINEIMSWTYDDPPLDFAGFAVHYQPGTDTSWESSIPAHQGLLTSTYVDLKTLLPIIRNSTVTVMVKAVDIVGIESDDYAFVVTVLQDKEVENILWSYDFHATGFPGVKIGCVVEGGTGDLISNVDSGGFWTSDGTLFWTTDLALFWTNKYVDAIYVCQVVLPPAGTLKILQTIAAPSWILGYNFPGGGSGWLDWPGEIEVDGATSVNFGLVMAAGATQSRVTQFLAVVDVPDHVEYHPGMVDTLPYPAVWRIAPSAPFNVITQVIPSINQGSGAMSVQVLDYNPTLGPSVQAFNAAGVRIQVVAPGINFKLEGY